MSTATHVILQIAHPSSTMVAKTTSIVNGLHSNNTNRLKTTNKDKNCIDFIFNLISAFQWSRFYEDPTKTR